MRRIHPSNRLFWLPALLLGLSTVGLSQGCKDRINSGAEGSSCTTQSQCGPDLVCDCNTGTCLPADQANPYCPNQDARVPEAGQPDAAVDAAQLDDAAATDAATGDAAIEDGGTSDASVQDLDATTTPDARIDAS